MGEAKKELDPLIWPQRMENDYVAKFFDKKPRTWFLQQADPA